MKRRVLVLGVFLLLGAVVNVAVAWGCAVRLPRNASTQGGLYFNIPAGFYAGNVKCSRDNVFGASLIKLEVYSIGAPETHGLRAIPAWTRFDTASQANSHAIELGAGWPAVTLTCMPLSFGHLDSDFWVQYFATGGYRLPDQWLVKVVPGVNRTLPLRPWWPGFLINTVFYAVILWLVFATRLMLPQHRRLRRINRGLCPACAYPVGTSPVCTECGRELPAAIRPRSG